MRLRRYCVTVMDNWTPIQFFWTHVGAQRAIRRIPAAGVHVRLYGWDGWKWVEKSWTNGYQKGEQSNGLKEKR